MQAHADELRRQRRTIVLVPTMGYLHEGHISLVRLAAEAGDEVVVSIFVNPAQFAPHEDLDQYPRSFERDREMAEAAGATVIFHPRSEDIYLEGHQTHVILSDLPQHMCGLSRPIFFRGVATVVSKLFNIVKPHKAVFGEKDYQQLLVIRQMVRDLSFDIEILSGPLVREADGLAMSSRNAYLDPDQRRQALCLSQALARSAERVSDGERSAAALIREARELIRARPDADIDYIAICDPRTLEERETITGPTLMALAVKIGSTRLIDNRMLTP